MPFPPEIKVRALAACGRSCSICHKFCGIKIECHHIIQEANGGSDSLENCIPLCFDCHSDMLSYDDKHPKGTKYRPEELRLHRDHWFTKVTTAQPADYDDSHKTLDQRLLRQIFKALPWNGSIGFLSHNNFAGFSFVVDFLSDLYEFDSHSGDPNWEFIDPVLEIIRATLASHISDFLILIAKNTWPTIKGRSSVPEEWEFEQPERFSEVVKEIHDTAKLCIETYKQLVREGRHRLSIEAPPDEPADNTSI